MTSECKIYIGRKVQSNLACKTIIKKSNEWS